MLYLLIALGVIVLILCVGYYLFIRSCRRVPERPWLEPEKLAGTALAVFSDSIIAAHKWLMDHEARDVWICSRDGLKLHGLWIPAEKPVGTMLLAHGYHSTYLVDFSSALASYHDQGLNLLVPDQRSHGKSEGKYTTFGVKESRDMVDWIDYHNQQLWNGPIVLSGMSMGASTVLYTVDEALPQNVRGVIADCGFLSPAAIIAKVFKDVTHLPAIPWIWGAELFAKLLAGFSLWEKDSRRCLVNNQLPVLLVHGKADDFVPCSMTQRAFASCGGDKAILLVEGAGHGVSFLKDKQAYRACVRSILTKAFGEAYELRNNQKL